MLCYPFEEKRLEKWKSTVLVQPKLDGERCRAVVAIEPLLISSEMNLRNIALPSLIESLQILYIQLGYEVELDGELYVHGWDFNEIHSAVSRTANVSPVESQVEFHVFDVVDEKLAQIDRIQKLLNIATHFPPNIKLVPTTPAENLVGVRRIFQRYIDDGYEGIIVRHLHAPYIRRRSTFIMKFKPKKSDVYNIVDYVEGKGKYENTIGTIVCVDDTGTKFEVGSFAITDEQREKLWNMRGELTQFACKVGYQHRWSTGKPKSGVFIELVNRVGEVEDVNPFI